MKRTPFRRTLGALLAIFLFAATLFGGINPAGAQEPDTTGTPVAGSEADKTAASDPVPSDCFIVSAVESLPVPTEGGTGDGGTTINIEITINVDSEGNATVVGGEAGAIPSGEGFAIAEVPNITVTELKPTDAIPTDKVTTGEIPVNIGQGEFNLADSDCDFVPADSGAPTEDSAASTPEAELTPADDTATEPETCTVTSETTLADGTTEKILTCPAA